MLLATYQAYWPSKNIGFSKECLVSSAKQMCSAFLWRVFVLLVKPEWLGRYSVTEKLKSQVKYRDNPATHPYIISRAILFSIKWSESDTVGRIRLLRDGPSSLV